MIISELLIHIVNLNLRGQTFRAEKWTIREMISKEWPHQFSSVDSIGGAEIEGVANGCEVLGNTAATSAVDVHDHHRA